MTQQIISALTFVLALNMIFFLAELAIVNDHPESNVKFFNVEGSMINDFDAGNNTLNEDLEIGRASCRERV